MVGTFNILEFKLILPCNGSSFTETVEANNNPLAEKINTNIFMRRFMKFRYLLIVLMSYIPIVSVANADNGKFAEQLNSIYFCATPEAAAGLVTTFNKDDDFDQRTYVDSTSDCGRLPPNVQAKLYVLFDTEKNGVVQVKISEPALDGSPFVWLDSRQSVALIGEYNKTQKDKPESILFTQTQLGCPTLEAATEHRRLSRLATKAGTGVVFLGMSHDDGKKNKGAKFDCINIKPGTRADMYMSKAINGFVPFEMYDKSRSTVWVSSQPTQ